MTYKSIDGVAARPTRTNTAGGSLSRSGVAEAVWRDPRLGGRVVPPERSSRTDREKKSVSWKERLQMPLIVIGGMSAGFAIQNIMLGQILIVIFGIVSLIYRIPSRISFGLALAALLATTVLLLFVGNVMLSQTFAVYTFLFLVVGVITLNRELKKEGGRIYSRRPRI